MYYASGTSDDRFRLMEVRRERAMVGVEALEWLLHYRHSLIGRFLDPPISNENRTAKLTVTALNTLSTGLRRAKASAG